MAELPPIPIPWTQRWKYIRFQLLPFGIFLVCVGLTGWLWSRHFAVPTAVGEVFANRADITSSQDGTLGPIGQREIQLFQRVEEGDVVARIDNAELLGELNVLETDVRRLEESLGEIRETVRVDNLKRMETAQQRDAAEKARLSIFIRESRIKLAQTKALVETDAAELARLEDIYKTAETAFKNRGISRQEMLVAERDRDVVKKRIEENKKVWTQTKDEFLAAQNEMKITTKVELGDAEPLLAPVRAEIETQKAMVASMQLQIKALEIRTPISGVVTAIYARPGAQVTAGLPIMTVAATESQYVVSYIRQGRHAEPKPGMAVDIHPRTLPVQPISAHIEHVGPQIELVPEHQRRIAMTPEWGQLVRIPLPIGVALRPGELVDIRIKPNTIAREPAPRTTADKPPGPPET